MTMRLRSLFLLMVGGAGWPIRALAHADGAKPHDWGELMRAWEFDPLVVAGLGLSAVLYGRGLRRFRSATGSGSGIKRWQVWSFTAGWVAAFIALISPLHPWGRVLFSAHMTQHEILMLIAAPLMVMGNPLVIFLWALPKDAARRLGNWSRNESWQTLWRQISRPFSAWLIHLAALWIWHLPGLFEATINNDLVHAAQHASFFGSALLFWWAVMRGRDRTMGYGLAVLYMFTTALHSGILGALLAFSKQTLYPSYAETAPLWGLSGIEDQQLGGLIMWIPAGIIYIVAGLIFFAGWLHFSEKKALRPAAAALLVATIFSSGCGGRDEPETKEARAAILRHGCVACHIVPGFAGPKTVVGPSLKEINSRAYIGGVLENTPENLAKWIQNPPAVDPKTAMPHLRLSQEEAGRIAAYLYAQTSK